MGRGGKLSPKCGNTPPSLVRGDQGGAQGVKTLGRWAGLADWLLMLCQLVLAKINLGRSDYCVIATVSLRVLDQYCVMSHRAIAGIKKEPGSGYPELRALLFSRIPRAWTITVNGTLG